MIRRKIHPLIIRQQGNLVLRSEIAPYNPRGLFARIGGVMDFVFECAALRLCRSLQHVAVGVVLPTVINAAQSALFVAAEKKRSAAVGAMFVQETDASLAVTKSYEVLAKQTHAHGRAVRLGNFLR